MLRTPLLYLSRSGPARRILTRLPGARRVSRRFVAGETLDEAMSAARALNDKGLLVTLDHLGENVHSEAHATRAMQDYLTLLDRIAESGVRSNVSLKLTQLGMDLGEAICHHNLRCIVEKAAKHNNFVRIDMESAAYTDRTLKLFRAVRQEIGAQYVGVVIQAYLYRSEKDMAQLAAEGANIRLCKGAYKEPPHVAFPQKADVDRNFIKLAQLFLDEPARTQGAYLAAATHDDKMIEATKAFAAAHNIPKDRYEFQMLYGIRPQAQQQLVTEGHKMRIYVPYGTEWYPYFMRRLAERPANVWFILKNLFRA